MLRKTTIGAGFGIILGKTGLPDLPAEIATENPWRQADPQIPFEAVKVGAKGFSSNCACCHGLGAISGGLAPTCVIWKPMSSATNCFWTGSCTDTNRTAP